jgi:hypothetical protein
MDINNALTQNILQITNESILGLLTEISKDYNINLDELKSKYMSETTFNTTKKRGRKKKIKDEYIEAEEIEFNNKIYLVDGNGVVYSNDAKHPVMLGYRMKDGNIHFLNREENV